MSEPTPAGAAPTKRERLVAPLKLTGSAPWEDLVGYSRAVVLPAADGARRILLSGCTSVREGAVAYPGDAYRQALCAFEVAEHALRGAGANLEHVVRSRMYVVGRENCDAVGQAHRERLGIARPATTMVLVAGLIDVRLLVEIELEAFLPVGG
jgi:enamine deaminase RidA (YjgF/YER057c/UK114 family)